MAFGKVYYVDVVTDTCSIRCIVIVSEYAELFQFAYCNLCDVWHQVVRDTVRVLTDGSALMSTDRVEVTKKNYIPLRICLLDICKDLLQHGFRPAIWVGALSFRALLCDRDDCRISVYGR